LNSDDDIIGPSSHDTLRDVFQLEDVKAQSEIGSNITKQGAISRDRVSLAFNVSLSGHDLLRKFSIFQIINRLKYERRKSRPKPVIYMGTKSNSKTQ